MVWVIAAAFLVGFVLLPLTARRSRGLFTVLPSEPISTMHIHMAKKHTVSTKNALEAATRTLR
jgi:hypothetical protein